MIKSTVLRALALTALYGLSYIPVHAQSLPDSLRQPVRVTVSGDAELVPAVRQHMELNLIAAEANVDPENAIWFFDVKVARAAGDASMIALSMITSQPLRPPKPPAKIEDVESGAWVKEYLAYDMEKDLLMIHRHDLVIVPFSDLAEATRQRVEQFRADTLEPIKRRWLRNPGH